jgi:DNA-binding NarL/FixJ family response regulator
MLADGLGNEEIAPQLDISKNTGYAIVDSNLFERTRRLRPWASFL